MSGPFFNQASQPMTFQAWVIAMLDFEARCIRRDELEVDGGKVTVSTVWYGVDQSWGAAERPMIFETMVFGGLLDEQRMLAADREAAIHAHEELVFQCHGFGKVSGEP